MKRTPVVVKAWPSPNMPVTEVEGLTISYDDRGSGEPALLCLTGWCSSKARYDHLVPLLAEKRRTLAFDWRGHGDSQRDVGEFGQEEMVADALGVIEVSGIEQVVPVAASHSGWVAIELRRRLGAERVPKIVHMREAFPPLDRKSVVYAIRSYTLFPYTTLFRS